MNDLDFSGYLLGFTSCGYYITQGISISMTYLHIKYSSAYYILSDSQSLAHPKLHRNHVIKGIVSLFLESHSI